MENKVKVALIDYGGHETTSVENCYFLHNQFMQQPKFIIKVVIRLRDVIITDRQAAVKCLQELTNKANEKSKKTAELVYRNGGNTRCKNKYTCQNMQDELSTPSWKKFLPILWRPSNIEFKDNPFHSDGPLWVEKLMFESQDFATILVQSGYASRGQPQDDSAYGSLEHN